MTAAETASNGGGSSFAAVAAHRSRASAAASAAADVAEICNTRRGRLALRSGGLFRDVMRAGTELASATAKAAATWARKDAGGGENNVAAVLPSLLPSCLGLSAAIAAFSASGDPSSRVFLAADDAAALVVALVGVEGDCGGRSGGGENFSPPSSSSLSSSHLSARALRLLRSGHLSSLVPPHASSTPSSVALAAIAFATDPHGAEAQASSRVSASDSADAAASAGAAAAAVAEAIKASAGKAGAIGALAAVAARAARAVAALPASALEDARSGGGGGGGGGENGKGGDGDGDGKDDDKSKKQQQQQQRRVSEALGAKVLWPLCASLTAIEHLTFACRPNEERALQAKVAPPVSSPSGDGEEEGEEEGEEKGTPFPVWLSSTAAALVSRPASSSPSSSSTSSSSPFVPSKAARAAQRAALAVLMNLSAGAKEGAIAVSRAGGAEAALRAVADALSSPSSPSSPPPSSASAADRAAALSRSRDLSVALGLFINVASNGGREGELLKVSAEAGALDLLCRLFSATADEEEEEEEQEEEEDDEKGDDDQGKDGGGGGDEQRRKKQQQPQPDEATTLDSLDAADERGAASAVHAYAAVALGLLLEASAKAGEEGGGEKTKPTSLRAEASLRLKSSSKKKKGSSGSSSGLPAVRAAVVRCAAFYSRTAAITSDAAAALGRVSAFLGKCCEEEEKVEQAKNE